MMCHLSRLLRRRRDGLAVITALAAVAVLAAPSASAWAASPLTGETLGGTTVTTNGGGVAWPSCVRREMADGTASFNSSGAATGPYPGSFAENQGSAHMFDSIIHNQLSYADLLGPVHDHIGRRPEHHHDHRHNQPLPILPVPRLYARLRAALLRDRHRASA